MTVVLDAGAFVAIERNSREVATVIKRELLAGRPPVTHGGVIGQVWRGGQGRQASMARFVANVDIRALDEALGKQAGVLLGAARARDVVDAALVLLAEDGDEIFTSDPRDLRALARASGRHVDLIDV